MEKELNRAIEAIKKVADPDRIILFGSWSKGKGDLASDLDLLVLKKGVENRRELTQKIYMGFSNIGIPVDVIVEDTDGYEIKKEDRFLIYYEIAKNGMIVYERQ